MSDQNASPADLGDSAEAIAQDVQAIGQIEAVPALLQVLCETTGMRFAAVARVTGRSWTACAVKDDIQFGLKPGDQLAVESTLCFQSRAAGKPIVIDEASKDPVYRNHHTPELYKIQSYVSVPIVLKDGRYFGNLCAIDPAPAKVSDPKTIALFEGFAQVIAVQLEVELIRDKERSILRDERAASELREQFIAILGHDLRNPLQAIFASGELIERKTTDRTIAGIAGRIKTNSRRMSGLINDVLDFARARWGPGIGVQLKSVDDLETALIGVVEEMQDGNPNREIIFDIDVTAPVLCDISRIQQVLSNLVGNALTHGASNKAVQVAARNTDAELIIEVSNDGEPIPAESLSKIFEPFWRQTTSADRQGLGLGLHIASQIVRAHKGTLSVRSGKEDGTRFTVRLPLGHDVAA